MLKLEVKAQNYQELKNTLNALCVNLFEFEERGFFDDGQNEWVHSRENFSLECSDVDGRPYPEEDTYNSVQEPDHENSDPVFDFADVVRKTVTTINVKGEEKEIDLKPTPTPSKGTPVRKNNKKNKKK